MSRRNDNEAHGCSPKEQAILLRTDAGATIAAVAVELGVAQSYVRQVKTMYSGSWRDNDRAQARTRRGCLEYAAALISTGKVYA